MNGFMKSTVSDSTARNSADGHVGRPRRKESRHDALRAVRAQDAEFGADQIAVDGSGLDAPSLFVDDETAGLAPAAPLAGSNGSRRIRCGTCQEPVRPTITTCQHCGANPWLRPGLTSLVAAGADQPVAGVPVTGLAFPDPRHVAVASPKRRGGSTLMAALILMIAASLLAAAVMIVTHDKNSAPSAKAPAHPATWDPRVADIVAFVEKQRGMAFEHPVAVDFLTSADFEQRMKRDSGGDVKGVNEAAALLRIEGLIGPGVDLGARFSALASSTVVGVYDSKVKRLWVKGDQLTPEVRLTMAHELTHALQDQHFNIDRRFDQDSQALAFTSVVEADALWVEDAYKATLPKAEQDASDAAEGAGTPSPDELKNYPPALVDQVAFPYVMGPYFLRAVRAAHGQAGVDDAFINPPTGDADILQPQRFRNVVVATIATPTLRKGERRLANGDLGQFGLLEMLTAHGPFQPAWEALQSYEDDAGVAYTVNGRTCQRINVGFSTPAAAGKFVAAAASWTGAVPGTKVSPTATGVELDGCDPGAAAPATPTQGVLISLVFQADLREVLQSIVLRGGLTASRADCIAVATTGALTPQRLEQLSHLSPKEQVAAGGQAAKTGAARCP